MEATMEATMDKLKDLAHVRELIFQNTEAKKKLIEDVKESDEYRKREMRIATLEEEQAEIEKAIKAEALAKYEQDKIKKNTFYTVKDFEILELMIDDEPLLHFCKEKLPSALTVDKKKITAAAKAGLINEIVKKSSVTTVQLKADLSALL